MYKSIPGFEDYMINEQGEVISLKNNKIKILKQHVELGYFRVNLHKDNKQIKMHIHRLLGITFLNCPHDKQIDHIDGNRRNNNLENLRVVTNQENCFNRTKAKGYYWHKNSCKWMAYISLNHKMKHLGYFNTEEDARQAYLDAKKIYHVIK